MSEHSHAPGRELQPHRPPEGITESDYEAIEDAVMETARGRWFLKEYARRMRAVETASLRSALERIERIVSSTHAPYADAMAQGQARERMESISERLLDISWYMRERGFSGAVCASIDEEARQLAATAQALAGGGEAQVEPPAAAQQQDSPSPEGEGVVIEAQAMPHEDAMHCAPSSEPACVDNPACEVHSQSARAPSAPDTAADDLRNMSDRVRAFAHVDALPVRDKLALFG